MITEPDTLISRLKNGVTVTMFTGNINLRALAWKRRENYIYPNTRSDKLSLHTHLCGGTVHHWVSADLLISFSIENSLQLKRQFCNRGLFHAQLLHRSIRGEKHITQHSAGASASACRNNDQKHRLHDFWLGSTFFTVTERSSVKHDDAVSGIFRASERLDGSSR